MEWFPVPKLGWLNGWVLLCLFYAIFGLLVLIFPRKAVNRLYDQTGWSRLQRTMSTLAKVTALTCFVLFFLTPLRIGTNVFLAGILVYALGVVLMVVALITFRNTPADQPVAGGVYRVSRNPQWVGLVSVVLGIAIAIGSWTVVILTVMIMVFGHFRILAEEQTCLDQYGESYREYAERVPRYLLIL
jgi:protein-S-isoprenylcysteine O-methyltransferase Ste14